jgi:hypothetical protein
MKLQQQQQQQLVGEIQQKQQQMQLQQQMQQQHIAPPLPLHHQRKAVSLSSSLNTTFRPAAAPTESTSALDSSDLFQQP